MRRSPLIYVATAAALGLVLPRSATGYQRIKFGPFEIVPSFAVEMRGHSNVYVASDADRDRPGLGGTNLLLDFRPGLSIIAAPKLEKKVKGLFLDVRYSPGITFFPNAPTLKVLCGSGCPEAEANETPDKIKFVQNFYSSVRYQASGRVNFSVGFDMSQPELSQTNVRLSDIGGRAGLKWDLSRHMFTSASYQYRRFSTPRTDSERETAKRTTGGADPGNIDLGTFSAHIARFDYNFMLQSTLTAGLLYEFESRVFQNDDDARTIAELEQSKTNGVRVLRKDYTTHSIKGTTSKRLGRNARGTLSAGYLWRKQDQRVFGAEKYGSFIGDMTVETLITRKTRLQLSAEYLLTDTSRNFTFPEFNAFTADQMGQFTVIPQQFTVSRSQRYMVDIAQNVSRKGHQVLIGFAHQRDKLQDQQGTQNLFFPGDPTPRPIADEREPDCPEGVFCKTTLADQDNVLYLVTGGFRMRVLKWLGFQVRGGYFYSEATARQTDAVKEKLGDKAPPERSVPTNYWSISGGLVVNLRVFQ